MKLANPAIATIAASMAMVGCSQMNTLENGATYVSSSNGIGTSHSSKARKTKPRYVPSQEEVDRFVANQPAELRDQYAALYSEGPRNAVLNQTRIGLAAMDLGYFDHAEVAFEDALQRIESFYVGDGKAKMAKSKFKKESIKDFKGEPYERAMAYFYRGLLYLREGDYENARASFLSGSFQDSFTEQEKFAADFAVLDYLAGWASQCDGNADLAGDYYRAARKHNPALREPADTDNVLFVAGLGRSPVKVGRGKHKERLEFARPQGENARQAVFQVAAPAIGESWQVATVEGSNVFWQASTRGGRPVDAILDGKAQFKSTTATVADVGAETANAFLQSASFTGNTDMLVVGAASAIISLGASIFSDMTTPEADTRYWDNLPGSIAVGTATMSDSALEARATFTYPSGKQTSREVALSSDAGSCQLVWTRSQRASSIPASAPGSDLSRKDIKKLNKKFAPQAEAFRAKLINTRF